MNRTDKTKVIGCISDLKSLVLDEGYALVGLDDKVFELLG